MKTKLALAIGLSFSLLAPAFAQTPAAAPQGAVTLSAEQAREENAYTMGVQAYLWGAPLYYRYVTGEKTLRNGAVGWNDFRRYSQLKTAKDRTIVTPNNVTIDAYARLDLTQEPMVVHVPALVEPRWYLVQVGNMFDEMTRNIGGIRGQQPGEYLITGPNYRGAIPAGMTQISSRTQHSMLAVRVFSNGEKEIAAAAQVQKEFQVLPLSAYLRGGLQYTPVKSELPPAVASTAPESVRFFDLLGQAMHQYLPSSGDQDEALIASFSQIGLSVRGFDWNSLDAATLRGLARAVKAGEQIVDQRWKNLGENTNGWRYFMAGGRAGYDFPLRVALVKYVIGAQFAEEVLYPNTQVDAKGEQLDGRHKYVLRFAKGQQPPASLFWNLSMYGSDMLFVDNDFGRYSIGDMDNLKADADGSITLLIQKERPADVTNWLPAPDGPFNLTMRFYGPGTSVLDGSYRLPAVQRVN
ncbi:DUF1254 domain-containing protein [Pseudomonas schmalbachii]|uniref:DUF1254 domain-containing protein n=1 Tax=Pseudomonas schmalbachii TaxID=2816993 RepID=A0ABS3TPS1_9PSED|nr:DUF1214 domain-containing protein [Pseudomonas schmalbachii]MBO3275667.1 DUF1254 domain-containing protein [Pseudomonas schmalbachii]